ncbi:zinc finger protein 62 homolog [Phlebotomus argentipes]|uniref:zinc finger protein 62 homolog n=1 Tax=Phlebotomus argentipes TaxID=94469 RepID=UPI0028933CAA|nr:zinc finger protein 62 homolog [Phlebotomus argentipes]
MENADNKDMILDLSIVKEEYVIQEFDLAEQEDDKSQIPVYRQENGSDKVKNEVEKKHICAICGKAFRHRRDIRYHITIHSKERKHKCRQCRKTFTDERRLLTHLKIHADGQLHECKLCSKTFPNVQYLRIHLKRHLGIRRHECRHCGKTFLETRSLKFHIVRFHEDAATTELPNNRFTCHHCGRISIDNIAHELHVLTHSDERTIECPRCPKMFKHRVHLRVHLKTHRTDKSFSCGICSKAFKTAQQLRVHVKRHKMLLFNCPYCPKCYRDKKACKLHVWNHHTGLPLDITDGPVSCTACHQVYDSLDKLMIHVGVHAGEKSFQCAICQKDFIDKRKLRTHMRLQHERPEALNKVLKCSVCGKGCRGRTHLALHQALHTDELPFECAICSKRFKRKTQIAAHVMTHSKERKVYSCQICGIERMSLRSVRNHESTHKKGEKLMECKVEGCKKAFNKKTFLNEHIAKTHKEVWQTMVSKKPATKTEARVKKVKEKRHVCAICGKAFYHRRDIRHHVTIHSTERKFPCSKCPKRFTSEQRLNTHMRLHDDENGPYPCEVCGKVFRISEYLRIHLKRHTGEDCVNCQVCGLRLASLRNLRNHLKSFHEETDTGFPRNQFTCDICGKNCYNKQSFDGHMFSHTNEKSVKCSKCPKMFKSVKHVKVHEKIVHDEVKLYFCVVCSKVYKSKHVFKNHLDAQHRGFPMEIIDGRPMTCTACKEVFHTIKTLKEHIRIHADERPFECPECGKGFKQRRVLKAHIVGLHGCTDKPSRILKCPQCGKGCRGKTYLNLHLATHTIDAPFECALCAKTFKLKSHVQQHVMRHSKERKTYPCKTCGMQLVSLRSHRRHEAKCDRDKKGVKCPMKKCTKAFSQEKYLTAHIHTVHMKGKKRKVAKIEGEKDVKSEEKVSKMPKDKSVMRFFCTVCNKGFHYNKDLQYHSSIHVTEKTVRCLKCEKTFADERRMLTHMRIHSDGGPHECKLCQKVFKNPDYLRYHLLRHMGVKKFSCQECDKKFVTSRTWKHHMVREHEGMGVPRPEKITCDQCGDAFGNKLYLRKHIERRHSDERKFTCSRCDKTFKCREDVRKHMRVHSPWIYTCPVCSRKVRHRGYLVRHMEALHRGVPADIKDSNAPLACTACKVQFANLKVLMAHIGVHANERPHECSMCGQGFKERRVMLVHVKQSHHGKEKMNLLKCSKCGEACRGRSELAVHFATVHLKTEALECAFCSRKFTSKIGIGKHMIKHSQEGYLKPKEGRKDDQKNITGVKIEIESD